MSISIEKIEAPELIRSLNGPNGLTRWVICFIDDVTATQFKDRVIGKPNIHKDPTSVIQHVVVSRKGQRPYLSSL